MASEVCIEACSLDAECVTSCAEPSGSSGIDPFSVIAAVVLLCFSALFSGLTLGLLSLDVSQLELVIAGVHTQPERTH